MRRTSTTVPGLRAGVCSSVFLLLVAALPRVGGRRLAHARRDDRAAAVRGRQVRGSPMAQSPPPAGLLVLANNDPVQKNARAGKPHEASPTRRTPAGLYCHAVSKVVVRLPGPGKTFAATVGVDSNEQTSGGRGSVVFSVDGRRQGGVPLARVMREGMAGVPVKVDLGGADGVRPGRRATRGDGIGCDQADWADAKVDAGRRQDASGWPTCRWSSEPGGRYTADPPFSFIYGGKPSAELLAAWHVQAETQQARRRSGREHTLTWTDPKTGLVVRCVAVEYRDFPTVEWTLYFKNTGTGRHADPGEHPGPRHRGSSAAPRASSCCTTPSAAPAAGRLRAAARRRWARARRSGSPRPAGGRPTATCPTSTSQWADGRRDRRRRLARPVGRRVRPRRGPRACAIAAGQELTHFKLQPGEEVRTPAGRAAVLAGRLDPRRRTSGGAG